MCYPDDWRVDPRQGSQQKLQMWLLDSEKLRSLGLVHLACRQGLNEEVYRLSYAASRTESIELIFWRYVFGTPRSSEPAGFPSENCCLLAPTNVGAEKACQHGGRRYAIPSF